MSRCIRAISVAIPLLLLSLAACAQTFAPGQVWVNQRHSELAISSISADGALRGTYTNQAAGFDCKNVPFDATGWVIGDFITFQVRWKNASKDCNSLTAWTGFVAAGTLNAQWELVYIDANTHKPKILQDTDTFTKK
jgi:hypothetical protein